VVFRAHRDLPLPEQCEGGVLVQNGSVFGVDVEEVEGADAVGEDGLDAAEQQFEDRVFKGMEQEGEGRAVGQGGAEGVFLDDLNRSRGAGGGVGGVSSGPDIGVPAGNGGHGRVELDSDDVAEGELAG